MVTRSDEVQLAVPADGAGAQDGRTRLGRVDTLRDIALDALGGVLVHHLNKLLDAPGLAPLSGSTSARRRSTHGEAAEPILVRLGGPGAGELLNRIAPSLRRESRATNRPAATPSTSEAGRPPLAPANGRHTPDRPAVRAEAKLAEPPNYGDGATPCWTVVRFDAWQYQRVQPPWWWLADALDCQLRTDLRHCTRSTRMRQIVRRFGWRVWRALRDPWVFTLLPVAIACVLIFSLSDVLAGLKTTGKWVVALTTVSAGVVAFLNAFRRQVLLSSRGNEKAVLRASDPMAAFQERYAFLLGSRPQPVAFLIENLDRCHGCYVVELLEGIETLLRHRPAGRGTRTPRSPVVFLVAADEAWLCGSFMEVYGSLKEAGGEPGRPFGLAFVDKVFDHSLHLPDLPVIPAIDPTECASAECDFGAMQQEHEIREAVHTRELIRLADQALPDDPLHQLRIRAVKRLGEIEDLLNERPCSDTSVDLAAVATHIDVAAELSGQLRTAYCSRRTAQLLAGHEIDSDTYAIHRLALWTVLALKWPLLADHLITYPGDIECLRTGGPVPERAQDLAAVFADPRAQQIVIGFPGQAELTSVEVRRFSVPRNRSAPCLLPGRDCRAGGLTGELGDPTGADGAGVSTPRGCSAESAVAATPPA